MPTNRTGHGWLKVLTSSVAGLLLVGGTGTVAQADSVRSMQWHLDAMHAEEMWRTSTGKDVTVAVIDSGVDPNNPDLKGRVLDGLDLASKFRSGDEHTDIDGHGTGMAGLIAGTGKGGAYGLAPGAKILPVRLPGANDLSGFAGPSYLSKAIRYAADSGARVINISKGSPVRSPELDAAVKYAIDHGSLLFAAVGNSGDEGNAVEYPAATPGVVGVAAVGKDLRRSSFSQYGPQVDMSAPGEQMVHACGGKTGLCKTDGTSDSTALASASAALIWSKHPTWTNNQVLRVMLNTIGGPTDGAKRNDSIGYGIVRPRIALQNPGDPGPADVYPLPDLKAAEKTTPPSADASASQGAGAPAKGDDTGANASAAKDSGNSTVWIAVGVAAVVLLAAVVAAVAISRKRRRQVPPPPPSGMPMQQTPYGGWQFTQPGAGGTPQGGPVDPGQPR
ncbi:type VII secretion-associated serine protease mycosin [Streptomyces griseosporeus]|uniref:type VII secretion-associated serine protease mycosin n=1 Tax=Streptomyces griseosporeus TaxID=1910 RepID=UPI00167CDC47|nr:type VII secretion-associated serine protease mycosin [Streptomyces griseosporeus]GHF64328.1 type VII secretion-associated serine protease [Streptomyces griseosporeus]